MTVIDLKSREMKLRDLIKHDEVLDGDALDWSVLGAMPVHRFVTDSREVKSGDVFLSIPPVKNRNDSAAHIAQALSLGAAVIFKEVGIAVPDDVGSCAVIEVKKTRHVKALVARRIYRGQPKVICGVTGTNGKTSVADFVRQLFDMLGHKAATIGTLGVTSAHPLKEMPAINHTSPDAFVLHEALSHLKQQGITHLALEASSHGIEQSRVDGVDFAAAGFTNLSHDHLDYHGTMDIYFEAKKRLFTEVLDEGASAVLNADTNYFDALYAACKARDMHVLPYGKKCETGLQLTNLTIDGPKQIATISVHHEVHDVDFNFIGKFQVLNALCAMGLVMETGVSHLQILPLLPKLLPVPGRLELIGMTKTGGAVYVDYAHTPDALSETLLSLRPYVSGMLTTVFGCGGERDTQKRSVMGRIAGEYSDSQIITDDNPRSEDPAAIRRDIMTTCKNALEIGDRHQAITKAIKRLTKNDAVLIAGKGHETTQVMNGDIQNFDDRAVARSILLEHKGTVYTKQDNQESKAI